MEPHLNKLQNIAYLIVGLLIAVALGMIGAAGGYYLGIQNVLPSTEQVLIASPSASSNIVDNIPTKTVDTRPLGYLPYEYVSQISTSKEWTERGILLSENSIREFYSTDECTNISIKDLGPLTSTLENITADYFILPKNEPIRPLYKIQYRIGEYPSYTIGPMGVGDINNTTIEVNGRVIWVSVTVNYLVEKSCVFNEQSTKEFIESLRF